MTDEHPSRPDDCDVAELFSAYLDGELLAGELDRVARHLGVCLDCVAEFRALRDIRAAVRTMPLLEIPERLLPQSHHGAELSAFLDGELATGEQLVLQAHMAECTECRAELHDLDAARTAVRSLLRLEPPEFLLAHPKATQDRRAPRRWQVATVAASAAAVIAIGAGVLRSPAPEPVVELDSLADRHIARASVEAGFTVVPAAGVFGGAP
jgi:anti-sigma factor RsiW